MATEVDFMNLQPGDILLNKETLKMWVFIGRKMQWAHMMGPLGQTMVYELTLYGTKENETPEVIEISYYDVQNGFLDTGNHIESSGRGIKSRKRTGRKRTGRKRTGKKRKSRKYRKRNI